MPALHSNIKVRPISFCFNNFSRNRVKNLNSKTPPFYTIFFIYIFLTFFIILGTILPIIQYFNIIIYQILATKPKFKMVLNTINPYSAFRKYLSLKICRLIFNCYLLYLCIFYNHNLQTLKKIICLF